MNPIASLHAADHVLSALRNQGESTKTLWLDSEHVFGRLGAPVVGAVRLGVEKNHEHC